MNTLNNCENCPHRNINFESPVPFKQQLLRGEIKTIEDQISLLHQAKFEKKKELLQEIHQFKIGDFVTYTNVKGNVISGRIDIINNSNQTKGGQAVIYTQEIDHKLNIFEKKYSIIYLHDWVTEPDERLRVLSHHEKEIYDKLG